MLNRQVVLKRHPQGIPLPEDFDLVEGSIAEPGEGQMLVRNLFFSLEAAIRGWLDGKANYFEPIPLGGAIRGPSVARVVESHLAGFEAGDLIFGLHHWEDYSLSDANTALQAVTRARHTSLLLLRRARWLRPYGLRGPPRNRQDPSGGNRTDQCRGWRYRFHGDPDRQIARLQRRWHRW